MISQGVRDDSEPPCIGATTFISVIRLRNHQASPVELRSRRPSQYQRQEETRSPREDVLNALRVTLRFRLGNSVSQETDHQRLEKPKP